MAFIDDLKQGLSDVTKTVYEKSEKKQLHGKSHKPHIQNQ